MATALVTCISCNEDTTFEYPDDYGMEIVWEHHCGNKGRFIPPALEAEGLPDGHPLTHDQDSQTLTTSDVAELHTLLDGDAAAGGDTEGQ